MSRRRLPGPPPPRATPRAIVWAILWASCLGIVVPGCEQLTHQGGIRPPATPATPPLTGLHFIHAVPDVAALDFYLDDMKLAAAIGYRKSSGTLAASPGAHKLEIRPAGSAAGTPPLSTSNIYLPEAQRLLITAVGRRNDSIGPTQLGFVAEPFGIVNDKELHLRFLHASPGAPRLDVTQDKSALWSNATFGRFSPTWASTASLGDVELKLKLFMPGATSGTMTGLAEATWKGSFAVGEVYTLIAFGELTPTSDETFFGLSLLDEQSGTLRELPLSLVDSGPKSALYVFHAASDAQAIDIYADNGARLVGGLAYASASPLLELLPGSYKLELRSAGTPTVLSRITLKLVPDSRWALFLAGLRSSMVPGRMLGLYGAPMEKKGSGKSWRLIHAVPDAGPFALGKGGATLFSHLGYPYAAPYRQDPLPSGTLQLRLVGDEEQGWNIAIPQTIADSLRDEVTTVYLTGTSTNPTQPLLAVALVESSATAMRAPALMPLSTTK
jgi:hypothetical protein